MQEVLSRTKDCNELSPGTEFYDLQLDDCEMRESDSDFAPSRAFRVKQACARWDDLEKTIVWDVPEWWIFRTLEEAEARYQIQRLALAERGFVYSDMDC